MYVMYVMCVMYVMYVMYVEEKFFSSMFCPQGAGGFLWLQSN